MKNTILLIICFTALTSLNAQVPRRILFEDFTEASSQQAFLSAPAVSDMIESNTGEVVAIQYHTAFQGGDTMNAANPSEVLTRSSFYNITTVPALIMDGNIFNGVPDNLNQPVISNRAAQLSPFEMTISHQLSPNNDSVYISAIIRADQMYSGSLQAFFAVCERRVYFNLPPGTTSQTRFENVMKKMVPDDQGLPLPGNWIANDSVEFFEAWALNGVFDINQLAVAGWVQEMSNKEVIQAAYSRCQIPLDIGIYSTEFNDVLCPGNFYAKVKVKNYGTDVLTSCTVGFKSSGGVDSIRPWTGNIDPESTGDITLDSITPLPGVNQFLSAALIPNFGLDMDPQNDSGYFNFTVLDTVLTLPFSEGFEGPAFPPQHWAVSNKNNDISWELDVTSSFEGNNSTKLNFYSGTKNRVDELYLPPFDFSSPTGLVTLYLSRAYTFFTDSAASRYDTLRLQASTDCGNTWSTLIEKGGSDLQTAIETNASFVPAVSEWVTDSVDLSAFNGVPRVIIKLSGKSGRGNNLYIDKIHISETPSGIGVTGSEVADIIISPVPSTGLLTVKLPGNTNQETVLYSITDMTGKIKQTGTFDKSSKNRRQLDLSAFDNGFYFITFTMKAQYVTYKIVILH